MPKGKENAARFPKPNEAKLYKDIDELLETLKNEESNYKRTHLNEKIFEDSFKKSSGKSKIDEKSFKDVEKAFRENENATLIDNSNKKEKLSPNKLKDVKEIESKYLGKSKKSDINRGEKKISEIKVDARSASISKKPVTIKLNRIDPKKNSLIKERICSPNVKSKKDFLLHHHGRRRSSSIRSASRKIKYKVQ